MTSWLLTALLLGVFEEVMPPAALPPSPGNADTPGASADPARPVAILPVRAESGSLSEDGMDLLASVLAGQLADQGRIPVISPEELRALLQTEAKRQALGGEEDDALREVSGAMGADQVVTGSVVKVGDRLLWQAALVKQTDGTVVHGGQVNAQNLQGLAARGDELALMLLGRAEEATEPNAMANRLGFDNVEDAKDFASFRGKHPDWGMQEALTEYIIRNNIESNRLAIAEALLFLGGGGLSTSALVAASVAFVLTFSLPLVLVAPPFIASAWVLGIASLLSMVGSVVVGAVDGFNRGFKPVKKRGCCRDDARIQDSVEASALRRSLAFSVLMGGPAAFSISFSVLILLATSSVLTIVAHHGFGLPAVNNDYYMSPMYIMTTPVLGITYACAVTGCLAPCAVGVPFGSLLLLWPDRSAVQDMTEEEGR